MELWWSYLCVLHQVFSPSEAVVELRDPPRCDDLNSTNIKSESDGSAAAASFQQMLCQFNSTTQNLHTVKQQTYLNFRVEGIAGELKTYLIIALKNTNTKKMAWLYVQVCTVGLKLMTFWHIQTVCYAANSLNPQNLQLYHYRRQRKPEDLKKYSNKLLK